MKNDREFTGTLLGFDDFVSMSLDRLSAIFRIPILLHRYGSRGRYRVVCRTYSPSSFVGHLKIPFACLSEITPKGRKSTKLAQTLLNGNNICMVSSPFPVRHNVALTDNLLPFFFAF